MSAAIQKDAGLSTQRRAPDWVGVKLSGGNVTLPTVALTKRAAGEEARPRGYSLPSGKLALSCWHVTALGASALDLQSHVIPGDSPHGLPSSGIHAHFSGTRALSACDQGPAWTGDTGVTAALTPGPDQSSHDGHYPQAPRVLLPLPAKLPNISLQREDVSQRPWDLLAPVIAPGPSQRPAMFCPREPGKPSQGRFGGSWWPVSKAAPAQPPALLRTTG